MKEDLESLIKQGENFHFGNNSERTQNETYGRASDELLGWTANVEDYIIENYGEDSGPFKLYKNFERNKLTGYYESDFNNQLKVLMGALKACRQIKPRKKTRRKEDNQILSLIRNPLFWACIVVITGSSFALGIHFGSSKFDKEKSDYYEENKKLKLDLSKKDNLIKQKDSIISIRNNKN